MIWPARLATSKIQRKEEQELPVIMHINILDYSGRRSFQSTTTTTSFIELSSKAERKRGEQRSGYWSDMKS